MCYHLIKLIKKQEVYDGQVFENFYSRFLVLLFIVLSGCSRGEVQSGDLPPGYKANVAGHISVTYFLAADDESKLSLSYFAQAFQDRYKDATVNLDFSTGDNRDARIASGDIGDVFFCWEDEIYRYAVENKVLMPLSAYLEVLDIDISNVYWEFTIWALRMVSFIWLQETIHI